MNFWVYILKCSDGSYYTGHTDNLEARLYQHETGYFPDCYTFSRRPVTLVFSETFGTRNEAFTAERQIKGWSRKKKEALIRGDSQALKRLAWGTKNPLPEGLKFDNEGFFSTFSERKDK